MGFTKIPLSTGGFAKCPFFPIFLFLPFLLTKTPRLNQRKSKPSKLPQLLTRAGQQRYGPSRLRPFTLPLTSPHRSPHPSAFSTHAHRPPFSCRLIVSRRSRRLSPHAALSLLPMLHPAATPHLRCPVADPPLVLPPLIVWSTNLNIFTRGHFVSKDGSKGRIGRKCHLGKAP